MIVTLLIPFAGFVWNQVQEKQAARQERLEKIRAEQQARVAEARSESDIIIQLLPALGSAEENSPSRGIALAILLNLASREALAPELVSAVQVAIDSAQQRVRSGTATDAERTALGRIAAATDLPTQPRPAGEPEPAVTAALSFRVQVPRVYVHIFGEADRRIATELETWIKREQHWLAPGIENVAATAARANKPAPAGKNTTDVRYFNEEDRTGAEEIAGWLRSHGEQTSASFARNIAAPSGQIEVWFPKR
jgi:hypothetical protein